MPSFPVNNGNYYHYMKLPPMESSDEVSFCSLFLFTISVSSGCILITSPGFISKFLYLNNHDWYLENKLYYYNDAWRAIVQSMICFLFIYLICILGLLSKFNQYKSRKLIISIIIIWFIINILISLLITIILSYFFHNDYLDKSLIPSQDSICDHWFKCLGNNIFFISLNLFIPMLMPLITFGIIHLTIIYQQHYFKSKIMFPLTEPIINDIIDIQTPKQSECTCKTRSSTISEIAGWKDWTWLYMFFIAWGGVCFLLFINYSIKSEVLKRFWEPYYLILMSTTSIIKFLLKRIGRKIDEKRLSDTLSVEYLMEFIGSAMYWVLYRVAISYHTPDVHLFILTVIFHILSEMFQCSVRINDYYFKYTNLIINKFNKNNLIYIIFNDKCILREWRIRIAMDIMIRMYVSLITAVLSQLYNISVPDKYFINHKKTLIYNGVASASELIYFIFVIGIYNCCYKINIIKLFGYYINHIIHKKFLIIQWCIVFATFSLLG